MACSIGHRPSRLLTGHAVGVAFRLGTLLGAASVNVVYVVVVVVVVVVWWSPWAAQPCARCRPLATGGPSAVRQNRCGGRLRHGACPSVRQGRAGPDRGNGTSHHGRRHAGSAAAPAPMVSTVSPFDWTRGQRCLPAWRVALVLRGIDVRTLVRTAPGMGVVCLCQQRCIKLKYR
jgi:hypothetical protein